MRKYENNVEDMMAVIEKRFEKLAEEETENFGKTLRESGVPEDSEKSYKEEFKRRISSYFDQNMAIFCDTVSFVCKHPDCIEEGEILGKESIGDISKMMMALSIVMIKHEAMEELMSRILSGEMKERAEVGDSVSVSVFKF